MQWHSARIVRNENASLIRREFEHIGIAHSFEVSFGCGDKVERWFSLPYSGHNRPVQVGIRKKADAHGSGLPIAGRSACCNLTQRSGFASASGIEEASMACSFASR